MGSWLRCWVRHQMLRRSPRAGRSTRVACLKWRGAQLLWSLSSSARSGHPTRLLPLPTSPTQQASPAAVPQPPRPTSRHKSACSGRALVSAMSDWFCAQAAFFKNYAAGMNTFELSMDLLYFSAAHHHIATRYNPRLRMIHTRAHGRALVCVPGLLK